MTPSDPVLDFSLPRFGKNGYVQWILRGGKGIYDSEKQIRVEDMSLNVYSEDEYRTLEMTMKSPKATLLVQENRAVSDSSIEIVGSNFKVTGNGWTWDGSKKEIEVKSDVVVEFSQEIAGMLSDRIPKESDKARLTEIFSRSLLLKTTPGAYRFQFIDSVRVISNDTELKSESLVAIADVPKGENPEDTSMAELELDSIDKIIATEQVVITQADHMLKAEKAEFSLRDQSAEFEGNPSIKTTGAYLRGNFIRSEKGILIVEGSQEFGRAQMSVYQSEGFSVSKEMALDQETVALADTIKMQELETENQFNFKGSVEVISGSMLMRTDDLTLYMDPTIDSKDNGAVSATVENNSDADFRLGEVVRVIGEGSVYFEQEGQLANCEHVIFYPREKHAVLSGSPKVKHEQAIIAGHTMELKPGLAVVNSSPNQPVQVILPKLPDLGAENLQLMDEMQLSELDETATEKTHVTESETVIRAGKLRMMEKPDHYLLNFTDLVSVEGTNLKARCGRMDVILAEARDDVDHKREMQVQTINAYEDIVFEQSGRVSTADKAIIKPVEGKVVLEGNAVLTDVQGKVAGHRITLHKGKGRATIEGDGTDGSRPRITLPEMDLPEL